MVHYVASYVVYNDGYLNKLVLIEICYQQPLFTTGIKGFRTVPKNYLFNGKLSRRVKSF